MEVLDEGLGHAGDVIGRTYQGWDRHQTGPFGRPPPPLTGDELVALPIPPDEYRLKDADLSYRSGQRRQRLFVEILTWLVRIRVNIADWYFKKSGAVIRSSL
jgi:hypothetical protein